MSIKVYRPIETDYRTQKFGESKACQDLQTGRIISKTGLTCPSGTQDFYKSIGLNGHNGEDWGTWYGEPLYFPVDAPTTWWSKSENDSEGGIGIDVYSSDRVLLGELPEEAGPLARQEWLDNDKKVYVKFRFWHLKDVAVSDAKRTTGFHPDPNVKFGQVIGHCDSTGASSGNHLHWSWKIVTQNGLTLDNDNGYYGALSFGKYFENTFCLDILKVKGEALSAIAQARRLIFQLQRLIMRLNGSGGRYYKSKVWQTNGNKKNHQIQKELEVAI